MLLRIGLLKYIKDVWKTIIKFIAKELLFT